MVTLVNRLNFFSSGKCPVILSLSCDMYGGRGVVIIFNTIVVLLALTGLSLIVQVKLAAGRECFEVQFPRTISPALYFVWKPDNCGRESGISVDLFEIKESHYKSRLFVLS